MLQFTAHFITPIKHSLIFTFEHHITANWINTWYTFKDLIELLLVSYDDMNAMQLVLPMVIVVMMMVIVVVAVGMFLYIFNMRMF